MAFAAATLGLICGESLLAAEIEWAMARPSATELGLNAQAAVGPAGWQRHEMHAQVQQHQGAPRPIAMPEPRAGLDPHRGPGMFGPMRGPGSRELDRVGATAEQRTQIRAIWKSAHEEMMALHQNQRDLHRQMASLMSAPELDPAAAETLRQQISAGHDTVSKRMLKARLDTGAVLTAEQRHHLAEQRAARLQHLERHRHPGPIHRLGPEHRPAPELTEAPKAG